MARIRNRPTAGLEVSSNDDVGNIETEEDSRKTIINSAVGRKTGGFRVFIPWSLSP